MKSVMFLKHGQVDRPLGFYADEYQITLSECGHRQIDAARSFVEKFDPQVIITSPLPCTLQTAWGVNANLQVDIIKEEDLRERAFRTLFGMQTQEISRQYGQKFLAELHRGGENVEVIGEEDLLDASQRVKQVFSHYLQELDADRILFVSHGGPHSWLCCHLFHLPLSRLRLFHLGEACYSKFSFEGTKLTKVWALNAAC